MSFFREVATYAVIVLGFALIIVGMALLILPGPGWLTIILGLILLAGHFLWARRLLQNLKKGFKKGKRRIVKELRD